MRAIFQLLVPAGIWPGGAESRTLAAARKVRVNIRMKTMNRLITLISLTTVVITIERFSPTTRIVVPPYGFLRLHEVVQMGVITAFSVIVSFLVLRTASRNFSLMQDFRGGNLWLHFRSWDLLLFHGKRCPRGCQLHVQ